MTSLDLTGRTAIVTGASRGIGLAISQQLAAAGANVVLTARKQEAADEAAAQVDGNALGVGAHATDEDAARRCVDLTLERFGSVDILVNNAGTNPAFGPLIDQDHARFGKIFDENYPLLAHLDQLHTLGFPILAGVSRKSFLTRAATSAANPGAPRLDSETWDPTTVANTVAVLAGAHILRVHDVRPAADTAAIADRLLAPSEA